MDNPANKVIEIFGGFAAVAKASGRGEVQVRRWTYPKERGGTGGLVPADAQVRLLNAAAELGVQLKPEHFFVGVVPDAMLGNQGEA